MRTDLAPPAPISADDFRARLDFVLADGMGTLPDDRMRAIEGFFDDVITQDLAYGRAPDIQLHEMRLAMQDEGEGAPRDLLVAQTPTGEITHLAFVRCDAEEDMPVAALLYWTGRRLALVVPENGNLLNPWTRSALGRDVSDARALAEHLDRTGYRPAFEGDREDYAELWTHIDETDPSGWAAYSLPTMIAWTARALDIVFVDGARDSNG